MNDLGFALGWLAIQVTLVLAPALVLQALAARRGPFTGAWVAAWGLGMSLALGLTLIFPFVDIRTSLVPESLASGTKNPIWSVAQRNVSSFNPKSVDQSNHVRLTFENLRTTWQGIELRASEPVLRFRPWCRSLAILTLIGSSFSLIRLGLGLWAVSHCRRTGTLIIDENLIQIVEELRVSMECRPAVSVRELPDLTSPATAGWRRPMLLLPADWRAWDSAEIRAVIAHELAHIIRNDYAAGLMAQVAIVLHFYHPLVRWMAARLTIQQELAADSLGAGFSGGRAQYLVALSGLALKQDGKSPSWPARAFLPTRGTLIRRIKMLRLENETKNEQAGWSKARRAAMAFGFIALTIGVAALKRPAQAADDKPFISGTSTVSIGPITNSSPFELNYISEGSMGVIAVRPAAMVRRLGKDSPLIKMITGNDLSEMFNEMSDVKDHVDTSLPGALKIGAEQLESMVIAYKIAGARIPGADPSTANHQLELGEAGGVTVRTVAPFDWLKFFSQWKVEFEEVREPQGVYHRIVTPLVNKMGLHVGLYFPDDRTMVYEKEPVLKQLISRTGPSAPAYLSGPEWKRVHQDLCAVVINNKADVFAKGYDLGDRNQADDTIFLNLIRATDLWVVGMGDRDALELHSTITARDAVAAEGVANQLKGLFALGLKVLAVRPDTKGDVPLTIQVARRFLTDLKIEQDGHSLSISAKDFGTMTDLAALIKANADDSEAQADARIKAKAEADAKKVKR